LRSTVCSAPGGQKIILTAAANSAAVAIGLRSGDPERPKFNSALPLCSRWPLKTMGDGFGGAIQTNWQGGKLSSAIAIAPPSRRE